MKAFDMANNSKKLTTHLLNLAVLGILFIIGYWLGKKYQPNYSPYMFAYMLSIVVAGLVFCNRFSDKMNTFLHPYSKCRKKVYYYGNDYDPSCGILALVIKYVFYMFVGFIIFPLYSVWALAAIIWTAVSMYRHKYYPSVKQ